MSRGCPLPSSSQWHPGWILRLQEDRERSVQIIQGCMGIQEASRYIKQDLFIVCREFLRPCRGAMHIHAYLLGSYARVASSLHDTQNVKTIPPIKYDSSRKPTWQLQWNITIFYLEIHLQMVFFSSVMLVLGEGYISKKKPLPLRSPVCCALQLPEVSSNSVGRERLGDGFSSNTEVVGTVATTDAGMTHIIL